MSHLVHLKNDGETTCSSQKTQKEKQLLWNVFWPITCLNLLRKNAQTQQAVHCVGFPCAWIMDKLISKWAKEEQPATTNILTDSVIFYGLWSNTIKPYIIKPWRILQRFTLSETPQSSSMCSVTLWAPPSWSRLTSSTLCDSKRENPPHPNANRSNRIPSAPTRHCVAFTGGRCQGFHVEHPRCAPASRALRVARHHAVVAVLPEDFATEFLRTPHYPLPRLPL